MQLSLIFLYLINLSYEYVIIPFKSSLSNIEDNLTPSQFMNTMLYNNITTNIQIGNPYQNLNFFLDFISYHSYILDSNLPEIKSKEKYNKNKSSSYNQYNKENETIFFEKTSFQNGNNSTDILKLNDKTEEFPLNFVLVTKVNQETNLKYSGTFGLGVIDNGKPKFKESGFIHSLKKNNLIDNYMFTLKFNEKNNNGRIIIGKNIYENYSDDLFKYANVKIQNELKLNWGWDYFSINYNDRVTGISTTFINPNIGVVIMDLNVKKELVRDFFGKKISENKCFEEKINNYYSFFYCNEDVNLDKINFEFKRPNGNITFKLDYNDLTKVYNGKKYLLIIFDQLLSFYDIYIGLPLLKKYDFIFEQDKKIMGFYEFKVDFKEGEIDDDEKSKKDDRKIVPGKKNYNLYIIIVVFFSFLLILYFIFIMYRKSRRKKKGFFEEEVDYEEFDKI